MDKDLNPVPAGAQPILRGPEALDEHDAVVETAGEGSTALVRRRLDHCP
ncbi:MAG TPA: hypothetical protein VFB33_07845 [Candidatus Binataceae bacterium]|nr:hypothetical protein [Candidatus Binataceae bacterium]